MRRGPRADVDGAPRARHGRRLPPSSGVALIPLVELAWVVDGAQVGAGFGTAISSAGDVNADGFSDVLIGADNFDAERVDDGQAWLYLGWAAGLESESTWIGAGHQADEWFGHALASAGDVDGDGYGDVVVGAPGHDSNEGRALAYLGSAGALETTPAWVADLGEAKAWFGWTVSSAGDVNADSYGDVIVGAIAFDNGVDDEGAAFLYLGSPAGLSDLPAWTAESEEAGAQMGDALAPAGDVNDDGYDDVLLGIPWADRGIKVDAGKAQVYHGASTGLESAPAWDVSVDQPYAYFGAKIDTADTNGDSKVDVIVGAYAYSEGESREGGVFAFEGGAEGLAATPSWVTTPDQAVAAWGAGVATVDANGDGYGDVLVGAPTFRVPGYGPVGQISLFMGSPEGLGVTPAFTRVFDVGSYSPSFGAPVANAGDVNGDGFGDVLVAATNYAADYGTDGRVYAFAGAGEEDTTSGGEPDTDIAPESGDVGDPPGAETADRGGCGCRGPSAPGSPALGGWVALLACVHGRRRRSR